MDLSCIISSGDLELYILGMLPEDEAYKIEQLALLFPEVKEELDRISESLEGLATTIAATPSPSVKDGLMQKLQSLKEEEQKLEGNGSTEVEIKAANDGHEPTLAPVITMNQRKPNNQWLVAASTIGLVLSLAAVIYLVSQNRSNQTEIASLQTNVQRLNTQLSNQQQQVVAYNQTMQMMQSAHFKKIRLTNLPNKSQGEAQVLWDTRNGDVYIAGISLPKPPSAKQYQLWAIVNGQPVDAGLITDTGNLAHKMKTFPKADAFAISIENPGGSPTPTEVYMMGKAV